MPKISGLGLGEIKKISGLGAGTVKKVSGLGLGLIWQDSPFPVVDGVLSGFGDSNATNRAITMPPAASAGGLDLVLINVDSTATMSTASSGWTEIADFSTGSAGCRIGVYAGIHGTAAALSIATANLHASWAAFAISNWNGVIADIKIATGGSVAANFDPPSLTPATGLQNYLWLTAASGDGGTPMPTAGPSGFTGFGNVRCNSAASGTHTNLGWATLAERNTVKNPGTFAASTANYLALTLSVVGSS